MKIKEKIKIIAEIGLNHLGDEKLANKLVNDLLKTNIDGLSFQVKNKKFNKNIKKFYQTKNLSLIKDIREKSFFTEMLKKKKFNSLILENSFYKKIIKRVKKHKKQIGFAISDISQINKFDKYGADFFKILSEDFGNSKLIDKAMKTSLENIYLSTGNSTINEIKFRVLKMKNEYKKKTTLIHTQFENNLSKINLNKIKTLKKMTKLNVAFGNHSKNLKIIKYSAKFNPCAIFFYVKSDFAKFFPDDGHAVNIKKINKITKDLNT